MSTTASSNADLLTEYPTLSSFTAGDIVISVVGGVDGNNYTDNQGTPVVLEEIDPSTGSIVGVMELPQTASGDNNAFSGEYGSSSEGILQLSADGKSLVIAGYGINAATYNAGETNGQNIYGNAALAQTTSIEGGTYTAVARVIADISYDGKVDTSTALYDVFNTNNPRSVATVDGTTFYISGQGVKGDNTEGVFSATDGASSATNLYGTTDTRDVEIINGTLYVSSDSSINDKGEILSFGNLASLASTPSVLSGVETSVTLTKAQENSVNASAVGTKVALSPEQYFFANATTLYVADSGNPKGGTLGDGGLQKWSLDLATGTWKLDYTISAGLNLVANTASSGTTGLIGLTAQVNANGTVTFYVTNATIGDLDQTYLYTVTDTLDATTLSSSTNFTVVATASSDTNIRGIAYAPSATTDTMIASGSQASGSIIYTGDTLTIASGATLSLGVVNSGGTLVVLGVDNGSLVQNGGYETISSGGTASGDTVWGEQLVSGNVSGETIAEFGTLAVLAGASATDILVEIDSAMALFGTASNVTLDNGDLIVETTGTLTGTLSFDGGALEIEGAPENGGYISALIENYTGYDAIVLESFNSSASLASVNDGADTVETVTEGSLSLSLTFAGDFIPGSFELVSLASGAEELMLSSTITGSNTVASGQIASNATIASNASLVVQSGGSLVNGDVLSGGVATISGTDQGSVIQSGGTEVITGGTLTGDLVYGLQTIASGTGAQITGETIFNGGTLDIENKSNTISASTIETGGLLIINGNAAGNNLVLAGGTIALNSAKANLTNLTFSGAGTVTDSSTISHGTGGVFGIIEGFGADDTIALSGIGTGATYTTTTDGTNTTLSISGGSAEGAEIDSFTFAGSFTADYFSLSNTGVLTTNSDYGNLTIASGESLSAGYSVANGGTLDVLQGGTANGVTVLSGGTAAYAGTDNATTIASGGIVSLTGTETNILVQSGGVENISSGTISGGTVSGFQHVLTNTTGAYITGETIENGGTLLIDNKSNTVASTTVETGGLFTINGNASGNSMVIAGGTIDLDSPKANLSHLTFAGAGTLVESAVITSGGVTGAIEGFTTSDVIDLAAIGNGATLTSSTDGTNTTISVAGGSTEGTNIETFTFAGTGLGFTLATDAAGKGEVLEEAYCYMPGTMILTPTGQVAVEKLAIGDALVTRFGGIRKLKWIGIQRYAGRFLANNPDMVPVRIKANALGEGLPQRDLLISPGHSVLVENALVLAKNLVNGITVLQEPAPELVEYYALEFETHDCVLAEGLFSESFADAPGFRNQFHNVAEFHALYPDYEAPEALSLCAPRPEHGPDLAALLRPVVENAAAMTEPGPLQGFVEQIDANGRIEGWAQDVANPNLPVMLEIYTGARHLGNVLACDYRVDLRKAGIGTGNAKFSFQVPGKLTRAQRAAIIVRRQGDGAMLANLQAPLKATRKTA